jgi:hypothetical protein
LLLLLLLLLLCLLRGKTNEISTNLFATFVRPFCHFPPYSSTHSCKCFYRRLLAAAAAAVSITPQLDEHLQNGKFDFLPSFLPS